MTIKDDVLNDLMALREKVCAAIITAQAIPDRVPTDTMGLKGYAEHMNAIGDAYDDITTHMVRADGSITKGITKTRLTCECMAVLTAG